MKIVIKADEVPDLPDIARAVIRAQGQVIKIDCGSKENMRLIMEELGPFAFVMSWGGLMPGHELTISDGKPRSR